MSGGLPIDQLLCGDAVELSRELLPDDSIDGIATDPPYGLEFMGEEWDSFRAKNVIKQTCGVMARKGFGALPSFSAKDNVKCPICEKWEYDHEGRKCECGGANLWSRLMFGGTYQLWTTSWAKEAYRVLKPGASMLVMGGTRTYHRMACGVEDAGFIIKDCLAWCYNSGFPKSQDLGIMFDKQECKRQLERRLSRKPTKAEFKEAWKKFRKIVGERVTGAALQNSSKSGEFADGKHGGTQIINITIPATDLAKKWDGWKVGGLKPSYEPILWAVKPPDGAYIDNVLKHGVGAINVDGCRIPRSSDDRFEYGVNGDEPSTPGKNCYGDWGGHTYEPNDKGRYPANMIRTDRFHDGYDRFYFIPKADRAERDEGLGGVPRKFLATMGDGIGAREHNPKEANAYVKNTHPTVKPVALMEHLIKLVTREGQIVLDPFVGSGTTCIAARKLLRHYIGFDNNPEYIKIAKHRLAAIPQRLEVYA